MFRDLTNPYENSRTRGSTAFMFLSALDEARLSPEGTRRLGEYSHKFEENEPPAPTGMTGGGVASPISSKAAELMTDEQWLQAMAKHNADVTNWDTGVGGSRELSSVFRERIAADPARFGRLALSMTPDLDDAYTSAMLMGLGESEFAPADLEVLFDAVRHLGAFEVPRPTAGSDGPCNGTSEPCHSTSSSSSSIVRYTRPTQKTTPPASPGRTQTATRSPTFTRTASTPPGALSLRRSATSSSATSTGERTELVRPHLADLASDPVMSVRACVAHTIGASLRNARPDAIARSTSSSTPTTSFWQRPRRAADAGIGT